MQIKVAKSILYMLFVNNGYWKLLALVIALLIYFSIRSDISHMRVLSVPVEVRTDDEAENVAIWSVEPRSVKVRIRGSYIKTSEIAQSALKCVIRARHKSSGILDPVRLKIRAKHIQGARDVRVVNIEPNFVDVKFDVPESISLAIAPPALEGNARGTVRLSYDSTNAVVTGSRRLLQSLDIENAQVQAEPINVGGRMESFTTRVRLVPPGDSSNISVDPAELVVDVSITSQRLTRKIEQVPVVITLPPGFNSRWSVEPSAVTIEVTGRSEVVGGLDYGDILASVKGNMPFLPGLTNEVTVLVHSRQELAIDEAKADPAKVKLIALDILEEKKADASAASAAQ
jgi:hypothetical protein